ncbi:MAG: tetratricopeptide repeat protein, partial [Candidatus Eremiobacterota bacterium]
MLRRVLTVLLALGLCASTAAAPDWSKEKKAGDEALKRKDYVTAIRIFEGLVRAYPEKVEGFNALGFAYFMAGDQERAVYSFRQALALNPGHPAAQHNLILAVTEMAYQQCRNLEFTEAVSMLRNILSTYPNHPEAAHVYFLLGKVEFYRGDEARALANWREVARRVPNSATARFLSGYDLESKGDLTAAAERYQGAVKKLPDEPVFRNYFGMCLARRGKLDQGLAQLRAGLKEDPELPYIDLRMNCVSLLLLAGQQAEAAEQLKQALVRRPDYGSLYLWQHALATDPELARRSLALAVARDDRAGVV